MRAIWSAALVLCAAGVVRAAGQPPRTSAPPEHRWLQLISEYARSAAWLPPPQPPHAQLGREAEGVRVATVPLVVLSLPVPARAAERASTELSGSTVRVAASSGQHDLSTNPYNAEMGKSSSPVVGPYFGTDATHTFSVSQKAPAYFPPRTTQHPSRFAWRFGPVEDSRLLVDKFRAQEPSDPEMPPVVLQPHLNEDEDDYFIPSVTLEPPRIISSPQVVPLRYDDVDAGVSGDAPGLRRRRCRRPARTRGLYEEMLALERQRRQGAVGERLGRAVPPLRFDQPMRLRARLTVPRADYTEPYTVWWDPASGASRIDFHGGTAAAYRSWRRDGLLQSVLVREDRTGAVAVRRCLVAPPRVATLQERALPALPDVQYFDFDGFVEGSAERLERWRYTLVGRPGEQGAVRGEALTFHHELVVMRAADNYTALPVKYEVHVDSSVLGPDCDSYIHNYSEATLVIHDPAVLRLDIAEACELVARTERMERVEPLREFTLLRRDPRYDAALERYKQKYTRLYADDTEEAVRKNVMMQSYRFTDSGNREGATFVLGINFLSDRLVVERQALLGAAEVGASNFGALPFPHSEAELDALRNRLPRNFDWRKEGAVTAVRNQWHCQSCWAFSVVGAVEGAFAIRTGRLVELSEQALVDCAQPWGANGCSGSWPSSAYGYTQQRGLPALADYTYEGVERRCHAPYAPPVTRIAGYVNVTRKNVLALKVAIRRHGPTVVIIDSSAHSLISYVKGYYYDDRCKHNSPKHAVLAVGWTIFERQTYLILKNSWGAGWGDGGYILMQAASNTCGVLRHCTYPVLHDADVQRIPSDARDTASARRAYLAL